MFGTRHSDEPQPPAAAYWAVIEVLGDDWILRNPPPARGRRVKVTGVDGKPTYWDMDPTTSTHLLQRLRGSGASVEFSSSDYDSRQP